MCMRKESSFYEVFMHRVNSYFQNAVLRSDLVMYSRKKTMMNDVNYS